MSCSWPHSGTLVLEDTGVAWTERGPRLLPTIKFKLEFREGRIIIRKWHKCKQLTDFLTQEKEKAKFLLEMVGDLFEKSKFQLNWRSQKILRIKKA